MKHKQKKSPMSKNEPLYVDPHFEQMLTILSPSDSQQIDHNVVTKDSTTCQYTTQHLSDSSGQ